MHDELTEATEALSSSSAPYGEKKRIGQSAGSNRRYARRSRREGEGRRRAEGSGSDRSETAKREPVFAPRDRSLSLSLSILVPYPSRSSPFSFQGKEREEGGGRKMRKSSGGPSAAVIGLIYGTNN